MLSPSILQQIFFSQNWIVEMSVQKHSPRGVLQKSCLRNSQNSQESTCARVTFLIKLQAPVNFAKFPTTSFLIEHLRWLLLSMPSTASLCQSHRFRKFPCLHYDEKWYFLSFSLFINFFEVWEQKFCTFCFLLG